jgi:hypothetical protein
LRKLVIEGYVQGYVKLPRSEGNDNGDTGNNNNNNDDNNSNDDSNIEYDPIKRAHTVIRKLLFSDQRRKDFKEVIKSGNEDKRFKNANASNIMVPNWEPLHDIETRWDSTYVMITCLLRL